MTVEKNDWVLFISILPHFISSVIFILDCIILLYNYIINNCVKNMKQLKDYIVNENNFFKNLGIGKMALIKKWLDEHKITNYNINDDFTIDVKGTVHLNEYPEKELPDYIQFRKVKDFFYIYECPNLESLEGCPQEVGGSFYCNDCPNLKSLKGCPQKVGSSFYCWDCGKQFTEDDVKKVCKVKMFINV